MEKGKKLEENRERLRKQITENGFQISNFQTNFQFQLTPFFSLISKPISNFN